jgi:hypothetical protein
LDVPSVRKAIPREVADQKILNDMADDANNYRRTATVQHNLTLAGFNISRYVPTISKSFSSEVILLARRIVRETMLLNNPDGVDARYPGRKKIRRAQLKAHGTWQEIHCDGYEKLTINLFYLGGAFRDSILFPIQKPIRTSSSSRAGTPIQTDSDFLGGITTTC